jgi:hypothetical protein
MSRGVRRQQRAAKVRPRRRRSSGARTAAPSCQSACWRAMPFQLCGGDRIVFFFLLNCAINELVLRVAPVPQRGKAMIDKNSCTCALLQIKKQYNKNQPMRFVL